MLAGSLTSNGEPPFHNPLEQPATDSWNPPPQPQGAKGLRQVLLGAATMLLVVGLVWGGYSAYRYFAPYYGLGYITGRSGSVNDVAFTVTTARCGLDSIPDATAKPTKGQFCTVGLKATNNGEKSRYLSLSMFTVQLDTGSRSNPVSRLMSTLSLELEPGETRELELVYDVFDGVRMDNLKVQIGYETSNIPLR